MPTLFQISHPPERGIKASVLEFSVFLAQSTGLAKPVNKAVSTRIFFQVKFVSQLSSVETRITASAAGKKSQHSVQSSTNPTGGRTAVGYLGYLAKSDARAATCETTAATIFTAVAESSGPF